MWDLAPANRTHHAEASGLVLGDAREEDKFIQINTGWIDLNGGMCNPLKGRFLFLFFSVFPFLHPFLFSTLHVVNRQRVFNLSHVLKRPRDFCPEVSKSSPGMLGWRNGRVMLLFKITFKPALTTHLLSSSADFTYLAQVDPMEPFVCMWSAVCNICWMTGHFFSITVVHHALLKISSSKFNHMRLVLHNISGKREALGSVTADGRMEVEDWRWHLGWPQPWCVALAPNNSFFFMRNSILSCLEKKPYHAERDLSSVEN